jgi:hypothetical protein
MTIKTASRYEAGFAPLLSRNRCAKENNNEVFSTSLVKTKQDRCISTEKTATERRRKTVLHANAQTDKKQCSKPRVSSEAQCL